MVSSNCKPKHCYCGSATTFETCCAPLLSGSSIAKTAEQLMRSRYSAFCTGNSDYLINTLHPSKRLSNDKDQLQLTMAQCQWLQLSVLNTHKGTELETNGEVEFLAIYEENRQLFQLRENSHFLKESGEWFYVDGELIDSTKNKALKLGRNDPCYCGSTKKYKRCHGST